MKLVCPNTQAVEQEKIKALLNTNYEGIKDTYSFYASQGSAAHLFAIDKPCIRILCEKARIIDKKFTIEMLEQIYDTTLAHQIDKTNPRNPDYAIVRHQFLEVIVRIAIKKYFETGNAVNKVEALEKLIDDCLGTFMKNHSTVGFKKKKFMSERMERILESYMPVLFAIFQAESGKVKQAERVIILEEWLEMCRKCHLINEQFKIEDAGLVFYASISTKIDTLNSSKHLLMKFMEFIEAMARTADKCSFYSPILFSNEEMKQDNPQQAFSQEEGISDKQIQDLMAELPIETKIHTMMPLVLAQCPFYVITNFDLPPDSPYQEFNSLRSSFHKAPRQNNARDIYEQFEAQAHQSRLSGSILKLTKSQNSLARKSDSNQSSSSSKGSSDEDEVMPLEEINPVKARKDRKTNTPEMMSLLQAGIRQSILMDPNSMNLLKGIMNDKQVKRQSVFQRQKSLKNVPTDGQKTKKMPSLTLFGKMGKKK